MNLDAFASSFHSAIKGKKLGLVERFLSLGLDHEVRHGGSTPLIRAVESGDPGLVELFVRRGAALDDAMATGTLRYIPPSIGRAARSWSGS